MITRIVLFAAAAVLLSTSSASAQGQTHKQAVISKAVLKSMVANKPKSKKPLGARAGIVRRTSVVATNPANAAPTAVRQIKPTAKRK